MVRLFRAFAGVAIHCLSVWKHACRQAAFCWWLLGNVQRIIDSGRDDIGPLKTAGPWVQVERARWAVNQIALLATRARRESRHQRYTLHLAISSIQSFGHAGHPSLYATPLFDDIVRTAQASHRSTLGADRTADLYTAICLFAAQQTSSSSSPTSPLFLWLEQRRRFRVRSKLLNASIIGQCGYDQCLSVHRRPADRHQRGIRWVHLCVQEAQHKTYLPVL